MADIQSPTAGGKNEERRRRRKIVTTAANYNGHYYGMGGRRTPAINTWCSAADSVQEGQHPLTGQRAANFRLLAN